MVTLHDVLHRIAQEYSLYSVTDAPEELQDFISRHIVEMHLAITTNVEDTELDYLERFGHGLTVYFRLQDYRHGRELAAELYYAFPSKRPDMNAHTGEQFAADDLLYLFIHIKALESSTVSGAIVA